MLIPCQNLFYIRLSTIIVFVQLVKHSDVNEQWQGNRFAQYHVDIILNAHNHMKIGLAIRLWNFFGRRQTFSTSSLSFIIKPQEMFSLESFFFFFCQVIVKLSKLLLNIANRKFLILLMMFIYTIYWFNYFRKE